MAQLSQLIVVLMGVLQTVAFAGEIPNTAPVNASRQAFMVQSGVQADLARYKAWATSQSLLYATKMGMETELAAGIFAAKVYREQSLKFPIDGMWVTLKTNSVGLRIPF